MTKLSSICTLFTDGDWIESKDQSDSGIRLIQTGNIGEGCFIEKEGKEKYISENTFDELKCEEVFSGDILISRLPEPVGRACIVPDKRERMITAVDCSICRVNETLIDKRYLCYFLQSDNYYQQLENKVTGTTRKRVSRKNLGEVEVNIPSFSIQKEVIDVLDKIAAVINGRKKELKELDNLIKSRFVEMFGTLENPSREFRKEVLKNLCHKITDGKHGGCTTEAGTRRYFVGAREIYGDEIHYDTAPEISIEEFEKDYKRCNVEVGDFLIVNTGATIGKSAIASDYRTECTLLQKSVALLKVKREVLNPVFLKWCYRINEKMYKVESASAQPNLLLSKINATEIYVPELYLQNQFVAFVEEVDKLKVEVQKSLNEVQLLMDSLMQEYFG